MKSPYKIILYILAAFLILLAFHQFALQLTSGEPLFDFTAFWLAGRLTLEGRDPYSTADWIPVYEPYNLGLEDNQTFLYPKPILPLFIPFSLLPLKTASLFWLVLAQVLIFLSTLLLTRVWPERPLKYVLPLLVSILIARSYQTTLSLGQLGGVFLLLLTGALLAWRTDKWMWGGFLLAMLALKPQLGMPLMILVSVWFLQKRRWTYFYGLAAGLLALLLVGLAFDPNWVSKFLTIGGNKVSQTFGYHPTLWGLTSFLCGRRARCSYVGGGLLTAGFLGLYLWLVLKNRQALTTTQVVALAVAFSLILTPYIWVYDQILLLIPTVVAVGLLIEKKAPFVVSALTPVLISAFSLLLLPIAVRQRLDVWNALVPLFVLVIFLWALYYKGRPAQSL